MRTAASTAFSRLNHLSASVNTSACTSASSPPARRAESTDDPRTCDRRRRESTVGPRHLHRREREPGEVEREVVYGSKPLPSPRMAARTTKMRTARLVNEIAQPRNCPRLFRRARIRRSISQHHTGEAPRSSFRYKEVRTSAKSSTACARSTSVRSRGNHHRERRSSDGTATIDASHWPAIRGFGV